MTAYRRRIGAAGCLLALLWPWPTLGHGAVAGADRGIDQASALEVSQRVIGKEVRPVALTDHGGRTIDIAALRGRPVVITMIYTSCYHTCPLIAQSLRNAVEAARLALGPKSFEVAVVGFDVAFDTPDRMAAFARNQGIDATDWFLLSADQAAIDRLAVDLGFVYRRSPRGFDHLAQTTIIDGEGRVARQVYGESYRAPAIVEPLKTLVFGRPVELVQPATLLNRIRLVCTVYDPSQDRYRFSYAIFIGLIVGAASLIGVAVFVVAAWRRSRPA